MPDRTTKSTKRQTQHTENSTPATEGPIQPLRDAASDRLITGVLRAGEAVAETLRPVEAGQGGQGRPTVATSEDGSEAEVPGDFGGLVSAIGAIQALLMQDCRLAALVDRMPDAFGDGDPLRLLFRNLFPGGKRHTTLDREGHSILSDREVEVLKLAAEDLPHDQIGACLGISARTVDKHFQKIFRKLGVRRPMQAVGRAAAMGYLDFDAVGHIVDRARHHAFELDPFLGFCADVACIIPEMKAPEVRPLAAFGLLLLAVSAAAARQIDGDHRLDVFPRGVVCEVSAQGKVVRTFGAERMEEARSIVVIPAHAAAQGFTPGNLLVVHDLHPQCGLNRGAITEFTPEGCFVRTFCGGAGVGTRLIGPLSLAFHADGRLLATSGWLTDAILAFEADGAVVRRFADGRYIQVCSGPSGRIYANRTHIEGHGVRVFDAGGSLTQARHAVAVNSRGHVFVTSDHRDFRPGEPHRQSVEEYDAEGVMVRTLLDGFDFRRLSVDAQDRLYVPCSGTATVTVLSPRGIVLRQIDVGEKVVPCSVAAGKDGRMWVCGRVP